jgi:nucleotide-binding universal stress UspA family protein
MKNILVLAHADNGQRSRLQVALDLTRALKGHLTCIDITMVPSSGGDYLSMGASTLLLSSEEEDEQQNRKRVEAQLVETDVPFDWIDVAGDPAICIEREAGMADLIVVNRQLDSEPFPDMLSIAGDLIVGSHTPVLAVPERTEGFNVRGRALVAWDGSKPARAAMRAAIPMLQMAGSVILLYADDGSLQIPIEDAAAYLSRHGIHAVVRRENVLKDRPGAVILAEAIADHVDYVVMGGFGRSRILESMFGGTTQRMLSESPVPVFLVHRP